MTPANAFMFLVFIIKRVSCDVGIVGYNYPQPFPPVQFDEPSTPSTVYLPPIFQDEILPPIPLPTYLPPNLYPPLGTPPNVFAEDDTVVIPPPTPGSLYPPAIQAKIINMSCVMSNSFKTAFRVEGRSGGLPPPVIDNGSEGCITTGPSGIFVMDMEGNQKMADCGVRQCSAGASARANMCVVVRMPTVRGIRLPEDGIVTLQCTPQDTVVSHTKHLRLGSTTNGRARSSSNGVVASGGSQRNFDSRVILLRKSASNNFDQPLQPGSVVQLGEELVLRAIVQGNDGKQIV